jgi:hypothetical protein
MADDELIGLYFPFRKERKLKINVKFTLLTQILKCLASEIVSQQESKFLFSSGRLQHTLVLNTTSTVLRAACGGNWRATNT